MEGDTGVTQGHAVKEDEDTKGSGVYFCVLSQVTQNITVGPCDLPTQGLMHSAVHSKASDAEWGQGEEWSVTKGISLFSPRIPPHLNLPLSVIFTANTFPNWLFAFYNFAYT